MASLFINDGSNSVSISILQSLQRSGTTKLVGCGDEGTASFGIDAVRKLTTSYNILYFTFEMEME
jgi:hypothetical protein